MGRRPGERRIEILAVDLERPLLEVGVADVGMDRGEPVERPAFRRGETQPAPCGAVSSHFDVDLKIRRLRKGDPHFAGQCEDRKSTRLNSSHSQISYAVFCLKKKKRQKCTPEL